jgi:hypothetical protein
MSGTAERDGPDAESNRHGAIRRRMGGRSLSSASTPPAVGGGIDARFTDLVLLRLEGGYDTVGASNVSQWHAAAQARVNLPF